VWPEDEAQEEGSLRAAGREVPTLAAEADAQKIAFHVEYAGVAGGVTSW
jgi:hypothetical protein